MNRKAQKRAWEAKCIRCGKCCHARLILKDAVVYGRPCRYLGPDNLCTVYARRDELNLPWCHRPTPRNLDKLGMPADCALRIK
jgi:uncharacterized cysteine cluster protein YcgN (CxxCxxCC family)